MSGGLVDPVDAGLFEAGERQLEDAAALRRDGHGVDETVRVGDEGGESPVDRGVALAADLVQDDDEAGMRASDPGRRLDELCCREWQAEHDHDVEAVDVDAVREHRGRCDEVDTIVEVLLRIGEPGQCRPHLVEWRTAGERRSVDGRSSWIWVSNDRATASTSFRLEP